MKRRAVSSPGDVYSARRRAASSLVRVRLSEIAGSRSTLDRQCVGIQLHLDLASSLRDCHYSRVSAGELRILEADLRSAVPAGFCALVRGDLVRLEALMLNFQCWSGFAAETV